MSGNDELLSGRYRPGRLIGVGGMSDVFEAEDTLLGRKVAIKKMRADLARDENFLARFRREARNAAMLNHPSIVSVYDTGETDGPMGTVPFIIMELVEGETLRDIVRREGPMEPRRACQIMASVCDALEFSHQAGIIHRDVKPANIMLTKMGKVMVMDFGIARALGDSTSMTQTAAVLGTAQYLSPEQARGKSADARSDIYAVGCVLYEALTGNPPFTGETPLSVAYQHVQDQPPRLEEHLSHLPEGQVRALDSVLMTAMAKDPMERYDSAADFAADLRRIAKGQVPLAVAHHHPSDVDNVPTTTFAPQTSVAESTPAAAAGAAGAAAGAGAAEMAGTTPAHAAPDKQGSVGKHESPAAAQEKEKTSKTKALAWALAALLLLGGVGYGSYQLFTANNASETVAIPQVAGMHVNEATRTLENAGFTVTRTDEPNPDVQRDYVIASDPAYGSGLPKGSRINLRVSSGPEITGVPDVRDMKAEDARAALEKAGLIVDPKLREEPHEEIARGHVIDQSPAAGSQVSKGTRVTLTVSTGLETKRVPDVTGQSLDSARTTLESMGFVVQVTEEDSDRPAGEVIGVPQAGETLTVGTTVEVRVSRGNQIKMPNLEGKSFSDAEKALRDAGFTGEIRKGSTTTLDVSKINRVEKTEPRADSLINKDGAVNIYVYQLGPSESPSSSTSNAPAVPGAPIDGEDLPIPGNNLDN